ncbi:MAG: amidohydrolase family protein, partial [Bacteroidales bacterium]|nr:amidohydrolase family protein [Bacteroidales bacterium]
KLVQWVKTLWEKTITINNEIVPVFSGIKIYPTLGFFPFDPSLDAFYKYASENNIPLLFHCTRTGSIYIGKQIENLIPRKPEMIFPETDKLYHAWAVNAKAEIIARIDRYYEKSWVKNNSKGDNGHACDLFSHPQNYVPILAKYPNLKICLAHMGGGQEVEYMNSFGSASCKADKKLKERWEVDNKNWATFIQDIMKIFPTLYTDISSTNTRLGNKDVLTNIKDWLNTDAADGTKLGNRILFGSDYFLTEIDSSEESLYKDIKNSLPDWYEKMMDQNINDFVNAKNRKIMPIDKSEKKDIA